ncbi:MAG: RnfABCDGE type electron transport complex subunit D [Planctomycetota bacterium]
MSDATPAAAPTPLPIKEETGPRGFLVSSAPHLASGVTTRRIMFEVVLAMVPLFVVAVWCYHWNAVWLTVTVVAACLITEGVFNWTRGHSQVSLADGSAIVTGMILAFSLPPSLRLYQAFIGGVVAIGLAKMVFGGLGHNLFNPAMVGRAFLMICFPVAMTTWLEPGTLHRIGDATIDGVTMATPLAAAKFHAAPLAALWDLFVGKVGGCVGETSALAALIGGLYLVIRGVADWRQPLGVLVAAAAFTAIAHAVAPGKYPGGVAHGVLYHLNSGALMFGAFFIATDYVGAPVTPWGRLIFGAGVGVIIMLIRLLGGYPEGVMYAVLIMNAITPLIERWTTPKPYGGHVQA